MPSQYYPRYSLRDLFRMGASTKRHRLGRSHKKQKEHHRQHTYTSGRRSKHVHFEEDPYYHDKKSYLTTLPPELQLSIFESLDPVSSTCLGLASRKLYPLHKARHAKVGLYEGSYEHGRPLCILLKEWTPEDLMLDWESERLISRDRYRALQAKREREGRRYRETSFPVHTPRVGQPRRHSEYESYYYDDPRPKLRRQRRFERHDLWYSGRY